MPLRWREGGKEEEGKERRRSILKAAGAALDELIALLSRAPRPAERRRGKGKKRELRNRCSLPKKKEEGEREGGRLHSPTHASARPLLFLEPEPPSSGKGEKKGGKGRY